jgi:hypothetical protein
MQIYYLYILLSNRYVFIKKITDYLFRVISTCNKRQYFNLQPDLKLNRAISGFNFYDFIIS